MDKADHWYLHVDLDAFFASVEQLDNPELRGKPVIVGGKPEDRRSVVSTASYEARVFGVHSAMPTFQAYKLCPQGIFVHGRMHRYAELSHQIMNIFRDYSPDVDQMSIDEAFIDLTGTEKLFGPPEETARKIKARVKKETGLTVSVGLASTKYLAKIASGLSKPDGFFHIKAGQEESFMLKLPLNKVWGLGPKSLELIKSKGINSTRDIYEKDYDMLEFLFGKNMASFLYNVVRGIERESFSRESKSHSISAETTFPYDLTDIYTIETELLELAQGVFFRLLKEESFSRTAMVKIRYEDFSTGTVQETVDRNIITLDSFYEIIKRLFEKRYQPGRGIRLLGVGFENVVKEERPYQQDLFSTNNDQKKQAVEKAILGLSKKHPEIKVSKARTLKAILLLFLISNIPSELQAQEKAELPPEEEPVSLFDYEINDKNHVDFSASGLWKIDFTGGLDITFGNGTKTAASPSLPVFKQETDISALLTLNNQWYFEAAFADEFTNNTFAFGYRSDQLVRHFRLANRGITMKEGYSAEHFGYSLRGGNNQAPGLSLELVSPSEKIEADFLLRYDMTESKSQIYYGMNRVSDLKLRAEDFAYGREFRFPQAEGQSLLEIENVYIESSAGSYQDERGKIYRQLRKDEYSIVLLSGSNERRLFIAREAGGGKAADGSIPSILLTFTFDNTPQALLNAAGSWNDETSFLGKIKSQLGAGGKYKPEDYSYQMLTSLEGKAALIIQNFQGFSPFLCPSVYDCGTKKDAEYLVIADKSEIPVTKYAAFEAEEIYTKLYDNFFDTKQSYVRITDKNQPQSPYPFAEDCPEIYLGLKQKTDLAIRARSYTPVTELVISKKAVAGTVQVYKNGRLLSGTSFNENTGVIELNSPVSDTDQLLITWQEETSDFSSGALAAGAGIKIHFLPELIADASLTTRIPAGQKDSVIEYGNQKNQFTDFSSGISFEKEGFKLTEKASIALLNDNTSEGLLLYSWQELYDDYLSEKESNPDTSELPPEKTSFTSFTPQDFSAYKKIEVELDFQMEDEGAFTGPLLLILDEDTGSTSEGAQALYLELKSLAGINGPESSHTITIFTDESQLLLDGTVLEKEAYTLRMNKQLLPSRLRLSLNDENQKALIKKLTFKEAEYYGSFRNYTAAEYKKDGSLINIKDFQLVKDLYISAESDQGSGNLLKPEPFVSLKGAAGLTLSGIKLSADAALQNLIEGQKISEAGHSLKTDEDFFLFKIISLEDSFRYRPAAKELKKENLLSLNFSPVKFPLSAKLKSSASDGLYRDQQAAELAAGYTQRIALAEVGLNANLKLSQKLEAAASSSAATASVFPSYGQGWLNISKLEFSTGKEEAASRQSLLGSSLKGSLPFAEEKLLFKPEVIYQLSDHYQLNPAGTINSPLFTDEEELGLKLPFSTENNIFTFEISRKGGGMQKLEEGGNYQADMQRLFSLQKDRDWFYKSIPFYELFDQELKEKLYEASSYAAKYQTSFKRSLYNSLKDLYVPSALSLALSREISRQTPATDLYQLKLIVSNNSINNFGSSSSRKLFSWFKQEELATSLSTTFKIPAEEPENFKFNIEAFANLLLFISEKAVLSELLDFSIDNKAEWNVRNTISYSRPSQTSLISSLAKLLIPAADNIDYELSRKDSFTVELGSKNALMQQKYSYNHSLGIDFLEYYNINAGLGASLTLGQKLANKINLNLTLGAKAEF